MTTLGTGKRGEYLVLGELLRRGASVYVPVVDAEGIDAIIRRGDTDFIEVQVKTIATVKTPRWFQITNLQERPNYCVVGVTLALSPPETWILPSQVFREMSSASRDIRGNEIFDLDLDRGIKKFGAPLRDRLAEYKGAWHLLAGSEEDREWSQLSESAFAEDWDSKEDAAYDRI
jgi:hypothetical protein